MVTSGKLAKGPRPPSLCPHGACWPWLKIVQFLCGRSCCCSCSCRRHRRAQPKPYRAAGCCRGIGRRGFTPLSNPPQTEAGGSAWTMWVGVGSCRESGGS